MILLGWCIIILDLWLFSDGIVILIMRYMPYRGKLLDYLFLWTFMYIDQLVCLLSCFGDLLCYQVAYILFPYLFITIIGWAVVVILVGRDTSGYLFSLVLSLGLTQRCLRVVLHKAIWLHISKGWLGRPIEVGVADQHDIHSLIMWLVPSRWGIHCTIFQDWVSHFITIGDLSYLIYEHT